MKYDTDILRYGAILLSGVALGATMVSAGMEPRVETVVERERVVITQIREVPVRVDVINDRGWTERDLDLLAATMWGEGRSGGSAEMRAIGHVILNRVENDGFGSSIQAVVLSPYQFSCWNEGDPNRSRMERLLERRWSARGEDWIMWLVAREVARQILDGDSQDPTTGATFYHTADIRPYWAEYGEGARQLGAHIFYATVRRRG